MHLNILQKRIRSLATILFFIGFSVKPLSAHTTPQSLPRVPNPNPRIEKPFELPKFEQPNNPLKNLPTPTPQQPEIQGNIKLRVKEFKIVGNNSIDSKTLQSIVSGFIDKEFTVDELLEARTEITKFYSKKGFTTSKAFIFIDDNPQEFNKENAVITIRCIEGLIESVNIIGTKHLKSFIQDRLKYKYFPVLNTLKLEEAFRLLQRDYPFKSVSGEFTSGSEPQNSVLTVNVQLKRPISIDADLSNDSPESVGTFRQSIKVENLNLLGIGENLSLGLSRTEGSNSLNTSLSIPLNKNNGTFSFDYATYSSLIIQKPFDQLNITSATQDWGITFRQPVYRADNGQAFREVAVGISIAREENQTSLDGTGFQLSQGADASGKTQSTTLSVFGDYTFQSRQQYLGLRSELSTGLPIGATLSPTPPDGEFFKWTSSILWGRQLSSKLLFVAGANLQIADRSLIQAQQFGFGGANSLPGYPTNSVYTDNGFLAKAELHYLIYSGSFGKFQIVPFFAFGVPWNVKPEATFIPPNILATFGVGLRYDFADWLYARLDWGIPIFNINNSNQTIQAEGLVLSVGLRF